MTDPANPGPHPDPHAPAITLPAGACDAHCHVFGPTDRFPYAGRRSFDPPESPLDNLQRLHRILGLDRAVLVQSAVHGHDHSALLDALAAGAGRYRGVALVSPTTPQAQIAAWHRAGVRGARLNFVSHLRPHPGPDEVDAIVRAIAPYGWHIAVHVTGDGIVAYADLVRRLPVPVVIDHMARVDLREGIDSPAVRTLRRLLDTGSVWVKLSAADRIATAPPSLADAAKLAALLAETAPERVVWGTDFPHPNPNFVPDDGDLVDLLTLIAPDPSRRRQLLVDNPATLFDFP
ncbi:amidohydrolase family protein [Kutzneria sp. NPDC052558]|uniref:amidohydrolase family protein n=1 Tax=Kutzneria sp. NPDC052558 TaxID=3364121 RepID=UPI0037C9CC77